MESSTEKILDRILKEANKKAMAILEEAHKSADTIIENRKELAYRNSKREVSSLIKKAENEAEIVRGRVSTDIKRKASWIILSEKNRLVMSVLEEVKNRLTNLTKSSDYLPVLEDLIVDAGIVLGGGNLEVVLNKNDSTKSSKLVKLEQQIAYKTGSKTRLTISKQKTENQGVILKRIDGKIFVDNTFEAILDRRKRELKLKIAQTLFLDSN